MAECPRVRDQDIPRSGYSPPHGENRGASRVGSTTFEFGRSMDFRVKVPTTKEGTHVLPFELRNSGVGKDFLASSSRVVFDFLRPRPVEGAFRSKGRGPVRWPHSPPPYCLCSG